MSLVFDSTSLFQSVPYSAILQFKNRGRLIADLESKGSNARS